MSTHYSTYPHPRETQKDPEKKSTRPRKSGQESPQQHTIQSSSLNQPTDLHGLVESQLWFVPQLLLQVVDALLLLQSRAGPTIPQHQSRRVTLVQSRAILFINATEHQSCKHETRGTRGSSFSEPTSLQDEIHVARRECTTASGYRTDTKGPCACHLSLDLGQGRHTPSDARNRHFVAKLPAKEGKPTQHSKHEHSERV